MGAFAELQGHRQNKLNTPLFSQGLENNFYHFFHHIRLETTTVLQNNDTHKYNKQW